MFWPNMRSKALLCSVFLVTFLRIEAFWWQPTTTETPTVLKHIPLTYFRTYTYQPLSSNPFSFPFYGVGAYGSAAAPQTPLLPGQRYDQYAGGYPHSYSYPAYPPLAHAVNAPTTPPTTTPSTTTTTTTTPAPTTTPSTTSTTTTTSPYNTGQHIEPLINMAESGSPFNQYYNNYNRRVYTNNYVPNYYRPPYPYPDYSNYQQQAPPLPPTRAPNTFESSRPTQVQFVPCMCPINVGATAGVPLREYSYAQQPPQPLQPSQQSYFLQGRSSSDEDDNDMKLPLDDEVDGVAHSKIVNDGDNVAIVGTAVFSGSSSTEAEPKESQLTNKIDADLYGSTNREQIGSSEGV